MVKSNKGLQGFLVFPHIGVFLDKPLSPTDVACPKALKTACSSRPLQVIPPFYYPLYLTGPWDNGLWCLQPGVQNTKVQPNPYLSSIFQNSLMPIHMIDFTICLPTLISCHSKCFVQIEREWYFVLLKEQSRNLKCFCISSYMEGLMFFFNIWSRKHN